LNERKSSHQTDLDHLTRLKVLSWLSPEELTLLVSSLTLVNFKRRAVIVQEAGLASAAHILLTGIARITCMNARGERVTVALLAPGLIPEFPAVPMSHSNFQCEAYNDCRVGNLSYDEFDGITKKSSESAFKRLHENDLKQLYRVLVRSSSFLNLGLHERIAIALLELCSDFGVEESRGRLLRMSFSHKDIAGLVGAFATTSDAASGAIGAREVRNSAGTTVGRAGCRASEIDRTHTRLGGEFRATNVKNRCSRNLREMASTRKNTRLRSVGLSSPGTRWHAWPNALMVRSRVPFFCG
jgi:CRP-like cAMP-binding protein